MKSLQFSDSRTGEEMHLAYSDYGSGQPVIFIHGWPSSREMWEYQLGDVVNAGFRVVKYDRRGFGKSSKPWVGYGYDTLASDLNELITRLDLNKVILVGFSMGGGEVARYIGRYGQDRIDRVVLISTVLPYLLKTKENPDGVDKKVFDQMKEAIRNDRIGFLADFGKQFFGISLINHPMSDALLSYYGELASHATQQSTVACVTSFSETDFKGDISKISVPTLIIHGEADKVVPFEASSKRTAELIPAAELIVYKDGPHGLFYTHRELLNKDLVNFFQGKTHSKPVRETVMPTPM